MVHVSSVQLNWRSTLYHLQTLGAVAFAVACEGIVGPPPDLGATGPVVPPDSIETQIDFLPNPPSIYVDGGVFSMVISARNRADHPVVVSLVSSSGARVAAFSYEIRPAFTPGARIVGSVNLNDPAVSSFAAGETKRQYFDFVIGRVFGNRTVTNGIYRISGSYGTRSTIIPQYTIGSP